MDLTRNMSILTTVNREVISLREIAACQSALIEYLRRDNAEALRCIADKLDAVHLNQDYVNDALNIHSGALTENIFLPV